ncbi:SRPBCC family protein [Actinoallomurus acaciae]|uniref:SRPBCC family protein n=1 Tax=Actinoallomurus acaciae TaxID=502577 RepID=A0ABV5YSJ1_9ACTN
MADRTSSSITIGATAPEIMAVIADFPAYPGWADGITAAEVLSAGDDGRAEQVRITLEAGPIKDTYVLAYDWDDDAVHWNLAEAGTMLTGMTGAYRLASVDGSTEVTYELAVDVRIPMIGMVRRKAEKRIIETALKGLKQRVEA